MSFSPFGDVGFQYISGLTEQRKPCLLSTPEKPQTAYFLRAWPYSGFAGQLM
jgi:hypothetical protein